MRSKEMKEDTTRNLAAFKPHRKPHISTAAAANSRRLATTQVARVSLNAPASVEAKFKEIGHLQLLLYMLQKHDRQYSSDRTTY